MTRRLDSDPMSAKRGIVHIPYEQWAAENPDLCGDPEKCGECRGTGELTSSCRCECGATQHTLSISCSTCSGTGKIDPGRVAYEQRVRRDEERWAKALEATP